MSYILEALKKSQQERELGEVPTITTDQVGNERAAGDYMHWVYSAVLLAIAALAIALFGVIFRAGKTPTLDVGSPLPSTAPIRVAVSDETNGGVPSAERQRNETRWADDSVAILDGSALPRDHETTGQMTVTPQLAVSLAPIPLQETVPLLREFPLSFQQSVPAMNVDVHVYLDAPNKRFVFINQRRYREGERTTEGPLVEKIIPEGIILHHDGQRFRLTL